MSATNFKPVNRHLWLQPVDVPTQEEENTTILVPDNYKPKTSPYEVYRLIGKSSDCTLKVELTDYVIVDSSMTNLLELNGEKFYLVLENYVFATFKEL